MSNGQPKQFPPAANAANPGASTTPRSHAPLRKLRSVQNLSSTNQGGQSPGNIFAQQRSRLRNVSSFHRDHRDVAALQYQQQQNAPPVPPLSSFVPYGNGHNQPAPAPNPSPAVAPNPPQPAGPGSIAVHKSRGRANSDAALGKVSQNGPVAKKQSAAKRIVTGFSPRKLTLDTLIREGPPTGDILEGLREMRYLILADGVRSDSDGMSSLRIYIWLILLSAPPIPTDSYLDLVHRGASPAYAKIRNDTFRTLATDPLFRRRVSEASLIRLLNAVAWRLHDAKEEAGLLTSPLDSPHPLGNASTPTLPQVSSQQSTPNIGSRRSISEGSDSGGSTSGIYVQGMNVLAAPFLYAARSEAEAFVAFHKFITTECPGYIEGAMDGVHRGLKLVDKVLALVDPKVSTFLLSKGMNAELYAFPSVLTLCACTPPLPEVLHLWDFLFAYGPHLNILCIVAQLVMMRDDILSSASPNKVLRSFPPLQSAQIKALATSFVKQIPEELYEELVHHAK